MIPEPADGSGRDEGKGDNRRRHRLVWEQEDNGEGAGLGLASTPAVGPRPPRRVWSRRITFDLSAGDFGRQQQQNIEEGGGAAFGGGVDSSASSNSTRSEISLAFSACLLPTGVNALLCSRLGAWMPAGARVYFNHFATGRLPCIALLSTLPDSGERGNKRVVDGAASAGESYGDGRGDADDASADSASTLGIGESELEQYGGGGFEGARDEDEDKTAAGAEQTEEDLAKAETTTGGGDGGVGKGSSFAAVVRRLFAVHESTGDLMLYDHHPHNTVRALSLPSGAGGLKLRLQCTLDPPPPPASPPGSFAACSNVAVFCGGGVCSVYDLCTGRLLGTAAIPRCPACTVRRGHRSRTGAAAPIPSGLCCTCGRRQQQHQDGRLSTAAAAATPSLWTSETRGHLVGVMTATQALRVRLPTVEACLASSLALTSSHGGEGVVCAKIYMYVGSGVSTSFATFSYWPS